MNADHHNKFQILLHLTDVGQGLIAVLECKIKSGSKYYLYDGGYDNLDQYQVNVSRSFSLITKSESSHCFKFSGLIISHSFHDCGLKHLIEKHKLGPTEVLAINPCSHFSQMCCRHLEMNKHHMIASRSDFCIENFFEDFFHFFYSQASPPGLYSIVNETHGSVEIHATEQQVLDQLNDESLVLKVESHCGLPKIQFSAGTKIPLQQSFCDSNIFQVPNHINKPKLSRTILGRFPNQQHIENAAKLLALYWNKDLLAAEIDQLNTDHTLYKKAVAFQSYMFTKETKGLHNENKFEKGFRKMFITHERLANDPDDCYTIDNPQVLWYYNDGSNKVFHHGVRKTVEMERKKQLKMLLYLCECVKWAYFYQNVNADLYFVSAGANDMPTILQALIGIIIACKKKNKRCRIALTNNSVIKGISQGLPKVVRDYISSNTEIWYLNDFDYDMPGQIRQQPFFTIGACHQMEGLECNTFDSYGQPKVCINTANSTNVHTEGMKVLYLKNIRTEQDFSNIITSVSSMKMHVALKDATCKLKLDVKKEHCSLGRYLQLIGHPNPFELITAENVLECVVGSVIVAQLRDMHKNVCNTTDLISNIFPTILSLKAKGQSEFTLNSTKTAASSAVIRLHNFRIEVDNKMVSISDAYFIIRNARSAKMTFKLDISSLKQPIDILKYLSSHSSCVGVTLAEHIAVYDPKQSFWSHAKQQTVGKVLSIVLGKQEAVSILQSIPLCLSYLVAACNMKHYLSYFNFDEDTVLKEAHIHAEPPEKPLYLCDNVEIQLTSLFICIFPKNEMNKRNVHIQGTGKLKGNLVNLEQSSFLVSKSLEIAFIDKFTPCDMFNLLGYSLLPNHEFQENEQYITKIHCSHSISESMLPELTLLFQKSIGVWQILLPQSMADFTNAQSYVTFHSFNLAKPVVMTRADFILSLNSTRNEGFPAIDLACSLQCDETANCHISILPSAKFFKTSESITGSNAFHIIETICGDIGSQLIRELTMLPMISQIFSSIILKTIWFSANNSVIEIVKLVAFVPEICFLSRPSLVFQNVSLYLCYNNQKRLKLNFQGKLNMQLRLQVKLQAEYMYSFNGECILGSDKQKWILCFDNFEDLTFSKILEGFNWASLKVFSMPIFATVLSAPVKSVQLEVISLPAMSSRVSTATILIYLEELNIGLVAFTHVNLTVKITEDPESEHTVHFELNAMISEYLAVTLEYIPEECLMAGLVTVCDFHSVKALDALNIFQIDAASDPSVQSFINLKMIIAECFMEIFNSSSQKESSMVAFMKLKIHTPMKKQENYYLECAELRVKDSLDLQHCIFDCIQFEYSRSSFAGTSQCCLARITGVVQTSTRDEMAVLCFDITNEHTRPAVLSAEIKPLLHTKCLSLRTVIGLCECTVPTLPNVNLPPILCLCLISGTASFSMSASFCVCSFDVVAIISNWCVFNDPMLNVHDLKIRMTWTSGLLVPKLIFDSSLRFEDNQLNVGGHVLPDVAYVECGSESLPLAKQFFFKHLLENYTPKALPCPVIPTDIDLPVLSIDHINIEVNLKQHIKTFCLNGRIPCSKFWRFTFGDHEVVVDEIGGALEWTKKETEVSTYRAKIHGCFHLNAINVSMHMMLGNNIDSIIIATIANVNYGQIADFLTSESASINQNNQPTLNSLVPRNMKDITSFTASFALNLSKKQFFLSGSIDHWGIGTLFVGYLSDQSQMDYAIVVNVGDSFSFSKCSNSLSFIDEYVSVRFATLVVSSVDLSKLSTVIKAFEGAWSQEGRNPFSAIPGINKNKLCSVDIKKGTTLYALLDVPQCQAQGGTLKNLFELGDQGLQKNDVVIKITVQEVQNFEIHAFIKQISLFGMLEFANIELLYKVEKTQDNSSFYFLELSGTVGFSFELSNNDSQLISFNGKLCISPTDAMFESSYNNEIIKRPAGLNLCVRDLTLRFTFALCKETKQIPEILMFGEISIGRLCLICRLLLKGSSFKVFEIVLKSGLSLTALFTCSNVDWSAASLNIAIKKGRFYYARETTSFIVNNQVVEYSSGYNGDMDITIFNWDFRINVCLQPNDKSSLMISGRPLNKIDLVFAKLTGTGENCNQGPELKYSNNKLSLIAGVELFGQPWFTGELSYIFSKKAFEGSICYCGRFLWIENPKLSIRWSKEEGLEITEFSLLPGGVFNFLGALARFAKVLYNLVSGLITWGIELNLTTGTNPDPNRYLVKLIVQGNITITIAGFITAKVIPLPDIPLRIVKIKNFSLSQLPELIIRSLWESAGDICISVLKYLNPKDLALRMGKMIIDGVVKTIKTVVKVAEKVVKKAWKCFKSIFGFSAFIVDSESKMILGYIYAGKGGRKLHNIKYTVDNFGAFLAANTINEVAKDVHTTASTFMYVEKQEECMKNLRELRQQTTKLSTMLCLAADDILSVRYISLDLCDEDIILVWQVGNDDGKIYSEDEGDIEYKVKVVAVLVQHENQRTSSSLSSRPYVQTKEIFNDIVLPEKKIEEMTEQKDVELNSEYSSKIVSNETDHTDKDKPPTMDDQAEELSEDVESSYDTDENIHLKANEEKIEIMEQKDIEHSGENSSKIEYSSETNRNMPPTIPDELDDQVEELSDHVESPDEKIHLKTNESDAKVHSIQQTQLITRLLSKIPIKQNILDLAIFFSVSIQPTITLRVKTLPPDNPMVDPESMDKYWMEDVKKMINNTGREKEVTLYGRKGYIKHFPKQATVTGNEVHVSAVSKYSEEEEVVAVEGKIHSTASAFNGYYLVYIFDTSDETVIVKEKLIYSSSQMEPAENVDEGIATKFELEFDPFKLPTDSSGPYTVAVIALTVDHKCLHHVPSISDLELSRCESPGNASIVLPNLSSINDCTAKVSINWKFPVMNVESTEIQYNFKIKLQCAITKQLNSKDELDIEDIDGEFLSRPSDEENFEYTNIKLITFNEARSASVEEVGHSDDNQSFSYSFDLKSFFKEHNVSLQSGATIKCEVLTVCEDSKKLPSLPQSQQFVVVASPSPLSLQLSDNIKHKPGLKVSWKPTVHAISYQLNVVLNENRSKKKYSKIHQRNANDAVKSRNESETYLSICDFQKILSDDIQTYRLCIFAQGFGEYLLRSLEPTFASKKFTILPVKLEYCALNDTVTVKFLPTPDITLYKVAIYQHNHTCTLLCESLVSTVQMSEHSTSCEFNIEPLRNAHLLQIENALTGYVHPASTTDDSMFHFGASNDCFLLAPPQNLVVEVCYQNNYTIDHLSISWSPAVEGQWYQYGFALAMSDDIIWSNFTFGTKMNINYSQITSLKLAGTSMLLEVFAKTSAASYELIASNITAYKTAVFHCIADENGKNVMFSSVSLIQECNLVNYNIAKSCLLPIFQNRLFPSGLLFRNDRFSSRILNKFLNDKGIFRSYNYAFELLQCRSKETYEWKNLKPLEVIPPQRWHSKMHLLIYVRCHRAQLKQLKRTSNKVGFNFTMKIYTTDETNQEDKKENNYASDDMKQVQPDNLNTSGNISTDEEGFEKGGEPTDQSWIKRGANWVRKVAEKSSRGVRSLLNMEPSKRVLFEHSSRGQSVVVSDKGRTKQGKLVEELQEVYLMKIAGFKKCHSIYFKVAMTLCTIEEAHVFVTYV